MAIAKMHTPPLPADRGFTLLPFWFWNDELDEREIVRQIADFEAHGVHGFVLHPRIGLPEHLGWMSPGLLEFMRIAVAEAKRRNMQVMLYDEGMYPSGSSCGQVVQRNADYACRCLAMRILDGSAEPEPADDERLVSVQRTRDGKRVALIDRKAHSTIRGLHYYDETPVGKVREQAPPMGDILNPAAVRCFIELVYDGYYKALGQYFGKTVIGIFTDEPHPLGRGGRGDVRAFTTGILPHLNEILGDDITPHLPALWLDDEPDAAKHRRNYDYAIRRRMEQTWYAPLSDWCASHGVPLCGHPAEGDEIGALRYFQVPGQDLVWRYVEPDKPSAIEGPQSTQAKATSSAMIHLGRQRNSNEFNGYLPDSTNPYALWMTSESKGVGPTSTACCTRR